ncbi:TIGR00725 family protein [Halorientalis sp. IM1011]|uniref:TIGR00725 family protein n=1 Tax=Halorientalis sp. IM1011 TaxID=1932360 RepID=UPI00097CD2DE|nr:TIGR00725 family protein [Halorientalis sp. IM1011]AQL42713.1 TIGR00725 family protein [Halorientalis sp. IM1011]
MRVSVIGGGVIDEATAATAREVGRELGERGHTVVCGGLGGVMEAVCEGTRETGGDTIGIVPGPDREAANEYVDTAIATDMGNARNVLVALNGDATIAIDGSTGTLSEIGHALDFGRPVAGIDTHEIEGIEAVESAAAAVDHVESAVGGR